MLSHFTLTCAFKPWHLMNHNQPHTQDRTALGMKTESVSELRHSMGCMQVCMDTLHWHNSPLNMSQCGSKGSPINIAQMVACVGQQSVGGKRAPNGFKVHTLYIHTLHPFTQLTIHKSYHLNTSYTLYTSFVPLKQLPMYNLHHMYTHVSHYHCISKPLIANSANPTMGAASTKLGRCCTPSCATLYSCSLPAAQ